MKVKHIVKRSGLSDDTIRGILAIILTVGWLVGAILGTAGASDIAPVALLYLGYYVARRVNGDSAKINKEK